MEPLNACFNLNNPKNHNNNFCPGPQQEPPNLQGGGGGGGATPVLIQICYSELTKTGTCVIRGDEKEREKKNQSIQ